MKNTCSAILVAGAVFLGGCAIPNSPYSVNLSEAQAKEIVLKQMPQGDVISFEMKLYKYSEAKPIFGLADQQVAGTDIGEVPVYGAVAKIRNSDQLQEASVVIYANNGNVAESHVAAVANP